MKKNKIIKVSLLIIGLMPFVYVLIAGLNSAINGLDCIDDCIPTYGIDAFIFILELYSTFLWPAYLVGLLFIMISIVKKK